MDEKMENPKWVSQAEQRRRDEAAAQGAEEVTEVGIGEFVRNVAQPPAPDGDVVEHMCEVFAASAGSDYHKGMFAAYAIAESAITARARKGWVPQSELSGIMSCGHRKRFESIIDGGHTPACQMCRAEKAEQQLANMVTLDAVEKAVRDFCYQHNTTSEHRGLGMTQTDVWERIRARLQQQEPTAQERVEAILATRHLACSTENLAAKIIAAIKEKK